MTDERRDTTTGGWASAHLPVVVGVDGSDGSRSALDAAAAEASSVGADLRVVMAVQHRTFGNAGRRAEKTVAACAEQVTGTVPAEQVSHVVYDGAPERVLLEHVADTRLLVLGKRGLGTLGRMFVGSTSLALVGLAHFPVAIVPAGWDQGAHAGAPIVVGVQPARPHHHLLHLAFRRAHRLGVPLVAVHGWEPPGDPAQGQDPAAEESAHARFGDSVAQWRERFPEVEVRTRTTSEHPALTVLDEAEKGRAQLIVLGRHHSNRFAGFGFGSVTRAVLHYAEVPVLVVPTDEE